MNADDPVGLHLQGLISAEVALARLVLAGRSVAEIERLLAARTGDGVAGLVHLFDARRAGLDGLADMLAQSGLDHAAACGAGDAIGRIRDAFDRAVACAPEASVAAYSLGEPAILAAATDELLAWLQHEGLLGPHRSVLDLGCGHGRVAAALAARGHAVLGLDVSPGMIAQARRRHHGLAGLRFAVTPGRDLDFLPRAAFDLVLAVDSFPYLVQAGPALAERHVAGAARALRRGGALAILNLSYRADAGADQADAARWAGAHGLRLGQAGSSPFRLWDGTAFLLHRPD
ncbi:MAG: class I SAM-dependent methyltransferase [Acidisphaera sp.]|nr:class I SAM-dependent methyltransferase [Acidisphaera sp.]